MTKKQYLQPEMLVSEIQPNAMILNGSPMADPDGFVIGGGENPSGAI